MRILNGDETDHALPFGTTPETLRVTLGTLLIRDQTEASTL